MHVFLSDDGRWHRTAPYLPVSDVSTPAHITFLFVVDNLSMIGCVSEGSNLTGSSFESLRFGSWSQETGRRLDMGVKLFPNVAFLGKLYEHIICKVHVSALIYFY